MHAALTREAYGSRCTDLVALALARTLDLTASIWLELDLRGRQVMQKSYMWNSAGNAKASDPHSTDDTRDPLSIQTLPS